MTVRPATEADRPAILTVHRCAFGQQGPEIAQLVEELLDDVTAQPRLSLVAEIDDQLVGHILFTNATLQPDPGGITAQLLAPLAVVSEHQRQGIGGKLVTQGLAQLAASGIDLVFVLGHPDYYSKFGFQPAGVRGFEATYPIPPQHADAWMVQQLKTGVIGSIEARVQCCNALDQPQHWVE